MESRLSKAVVNGLQKLWMGWAGIFKPFYSPFRLLSSGSSEISIWAQAGIYESRNAFSSFVKKQMLLLWTLPLGFCLENKRRNKWEKNTGYFSLVYINYECACKPKISTTYCWNTFYVYIFSTWLCLFFLF